MVSSNMPSVLMIIGDDPMLAYLLKRYAEQSGCQILQSVSTPRIEEIDQARPAAIIFSSLVLLAASQALVEALSVQDISVLVCAAVSEEIQARELGADACLLHPLTYENFCAALSTTRTGR